MPGSVEVRLRENVSEISVENETDGENETLFEYDEYTFVLPESDGLKEKIEANMNDWLASGRSAEINDNASAVVDFRAALDMLNVNITGKIAESAQKRRDEITEEETKLEDLGKVITYFMSLPLVGKAVATLPDEITGILDRYGYTK